MKAAATLLLLLFLAAPATRLPAETLTLAGCLREALDNNPQIALRRADVERARGTRLTYQARALPQLGVGGFAGQQGEQTTGRVLRVDANGRPVRDAQGREVTVELLRPARTFFLGTGNFSQALFDFAIPSAFRRGTLEVRVAEHNFAVTAVTVLHQVRLLFNAALFARENGVVLRSVVSRLEENERNVRGQVDAGLVARTSLLQARLQGLNLAPTVINATGSGRVATLSLLALLGRDAGPRAGGDPTAGIELDGTLETGAEGEFSFDPAEAAALARRRRPDFAVLRALAAQFAEDSRTLRAGDYPLIRLVASGTYVPGNAVASNQQAVRTGDNLRVTEVRYGVDFSWNLLDLGAVRGPVRTFRVLGEIFGQRLRQAEDEVPRDLARLRAAFASAAARRRSLATVRGVAETTLNAIQTGAAAGTSSQYELLIAQTDLLSNRGSLLQAALDEQNARADFDRVTGGYLRYIFPENDGDPGAGKATVARPRGRD